MMDRHKKSLELFDKFLAETNEQEFNAILNSIEQLDIEGPTVDEYFNSLEHLAFQSEVYVGGSPGDFLDMDEIAASFEDVDGSLKIPSSSWIELISESFVAAESNYAMAA